MKSQDSATLKRKEKNGTSIIEVISIITFLGPTLCHRVATVWNINTQHVVRNPSNYLYFFFISNSYGVLFATLDNKQFLPYYVHLLRHFRHFIIYCTFFQLFCSDLVFYKLLDFPVNASPLPVLITNTSYRNW